MEKTSRFILFSILIHLVFFSLVLTLSGGNVLEFFRSFGGGGLEPEELVLEDGEGASPDDELNDEGFSEKEPEIEKPALIKAKPKPVIKAAKPAAQDASENLPVPSALPIPAPEPEELLPIPPGPAAEKEQSAPDSVAEAADKTEEEQEGRSAPATAPRTSDVQDAPENPHEGRSAPATAPRTSDVQDAPENPHEGRSAPATAPRTSDVQDAPENPHEGRSAPAIAPRTSDVQAEEAPPAQAQAPPEPEAQQPEVKPEALPAPTPPASPAKTQALSNEKAEKKPPKFPKSTTGLVPVEGNKNPEYPIEAREKGLEGSVHLLYFVDEGGLVDQIQLLESSGHALLDNSAIRTMARYRYQPGQTGWYKHRVDFKIQKNM